MVQSFLAPTKKYPAILGVNLNGAGRKPVRFLRRVDPKFACLKFSGAKTSILLSCQKSVAAQRDNAPMKLDVLFGRPALRKAALEGIIDAARCKTQLCGQTSAHFRGADCIRLHQT